MAGSSHSLMASLGFLRLALIALAFVNLSIPVIDSQLVSAAESDDERSLWDIVATFIAPVMAPLLAVVIFFDYVMSRVRAADAEGDERARYVFVGRVELTVIAITLLYWVPYFVELMG